MPIWYIASFSFVSCAIAPLLEYSRAKQLWMGTKVLKEVPQHRKNKITQLTLNSDIDDLNSEKLTQLVEGALALLNLKW